MITKKQFALLFILCLLPFAFLSIREHYIGTDSYYFLNHVCKGKPAEWWSTSVLTPSTLDFIPCNPVIINLILFVSLLVSTLGVAHAGKILNERHGWMAAFFLFLSSKWFQGFLSFEDDKLGFPFLFISLYFFVKGTVQKKRRDKVIALILVGVACLFWKGAIIYFLAYALTFIVSAVISIPIIVLRGKEILANLIPFNSGVFENKAIIGILFTQFLFLGIIMGFFVLPYALLPQFLFWTIILAFNAKFIIHALPFYAISVMIVYSNLKEKKSMITKYYSLLLVLLVLAVWIPSSFNAINQIPYPEHMELIKEGIQLSKETGKPLKNYWDTGYWVEWLEAEPTQRGGYMGEQDYNNSIAIVWSELDCKKIKEEEKLKLYEC